MDTNTPARAATRLLLQQRLYSLRFDITKLFFDKPIVFDTIQHFCATTTASYQELSQSSDLKDAVTLTRCRDGTLSYIVLYNQQDSGPWRRRFTLAHELGHIYLGHRQDDDRQELEADAFAAQLLMPRILVDHLNQCWTGALPPNEICEVFGASRRAALASLSALRRPVAYGEEDFALLERFCCLLPHPTEPLVTV